MAFWSIPLLIVAGFATFMGIGMRGVHPGLAFAWTGMCIVAALLSILLDIVQGQSGQQASPKKTPLNRQVQGPGPSSKAGTSTRNGAAHAGSWIRKQLTGLGKNSADNPVATASVIAWIIVLACLFWLAENDDHFCPAAALMVSFHVAAGFSLAWAGKLSTVISEMAKNYKVFAWIWMSSLAAILAALYGYEDGFFEWWFYPPFMAALLSILAAGLVATGLHIKAAKAIGKAYFEWHGTGSMILWGFTLVIGSFLLYAVSGHEFFDPDTKETVFNLKWVVAAGFFLVVFSPVFFLAKKIK